jgi:hypothetical protein
MGIVSAALRRPFTVMVVILAIVLGAFLAIGGSLLLMKLYFHPGTNMARAMAETINYVNRSRAFMPPGAVSPIRRCAFSGRIHSDADHQ